MADLSSKKWGFFPGQLAYIVLSFSNVMPIKNAQAFFVHEEDENQHLYFNFSSEDFDFSSGEERFLQRSELTNLYFEKTIPSDMRPGTYVLDKINFETASGNTVDAEMNTERASFEVIAEPTNAPVVQRMLILPRHVYKTVKENDERNLS